MRLSAEAARVRQFRESLRALSDKERDALVHELGDDFADAWEILARDERLPAPGDWWCWWDPGEVLAKRGRLPAPSSCRARPLPPYPPGGALVPRRDRCRGRRACRYIRGSAGRRAGHLTVMPRSDATSALPVSHTAGTIAVGVFRPTGAGAGIARLPW